MKRDFERFIISLIVVSFIFVTTFALKSLPNNFCKFICWLGNCEDDVVS